MSKDILSRQICSEFVGKKVKHKQKFAAMSEKIKVNFCVFVCILWLIQFYPGFYAIFYRTLGCARVFCDCASSEHIHEILNVLFVIEDF